MRDHPRTSAQLRTTRAGLSHRRQCTESRPLIGRRSPVSVRYLSATRPQPIRQLPIRLPRLCPSFPLIVFTGVSITSSPTTSWSTSTRWFTMPPTPPRHPANPPSLPRPPLPALRSMVACPPRTVFRAPKPSAREPVPKRRGVHTSSRLRFIVTTGRTACRGDDGFIFVLKTDAKRQSLAPPNPA